MNRIIFTHNNQEYGTKEIAQVLSKIGIKEGDSIFVHSDLKSLGKFYPGVAKDEFLDTFINACTELVGNKGNVIMPTFSYSYCRQETFDPLTTPSSVGVLTEHWRKKKNVQRSLDPIFSVAVSGPDQAYFVKVGQDCFGKESIFEKLYQKNVKILFIGDTFDMTYLHFIEQSFGISHRYMKKFKGQTHINGKLEELTYDFYVRSLCQDVQYDLEGLSSYLENQNVLNKAELGNSTVRVVSARDAFDKITQAFKQNQYFLFTKRHMHQEISQHMYELMKDLFPICRSITGNGVRETLKILSQHIALLTHEVPSGTQVFDWTIPEEWNIKDAYILDPSGQKIVDFQKNNLHVVGYSIPVNKSIPLSELEDHLYSLPDQPHAIPYVTSYYEPRWGFCMTHQERTKLKEGQYQVKIDSELKKGAMTYGELIIPGRLKEEVLISTYICHPSMANNELSGPVVTTFLAKWLLSNPRKYTYRILFVPETIGAIAYLSKHLSVMQKNTIAGFNVSCVGDNRAYSYIPTRLGDTYADKVALNVLSFKQPKFIRYTYLDRGSDERQYNSPGVDLPVCSILRTRYGSYPEYHTSLDNLDLVTPEGLEGSYDVLKECLTLIEENQRYKIKCLGEPQLGKRGIYPTLSTKVSGERVKNLMNFIAYADGAHDLIQISQKIGVPVWELYPIVEQLINLELLTGKAIHE